MAKPMSAYQRAMLGQRKREFDYRQKQDQAAYDQAYPTGRDQGRRPLFPMPQMRLGDYTDSRPSSPYAPTGPGGRLIFRPGGAVVDPVAGVIGHTQAQAPAPSQIDTFQYGGETGGGWNPEWTGLSDAQIAARGGGGYIGGLNGGTGLNEGISRMIGGGYTNDQRDSLLEDRYNTIANTLNATERNIAGSAAGRGLGLGVGSGSMVRAMQAANQQAMDARLGARNDVTQMENQNTQFGIGAGLKKRSQDVSLRGQDIARNQFAKRNSNAPATFGSVIGPQGNASFNNNRARISGNRTWFRY